MVIVMIFNQTMDKNYWVINVFTF